VNATLSCPGAGRQAVTAGADEARRLLAGFRGELYRCLTRRGDALFGLADAVACAPGRVTDLARLSLVPECGRGHGALYGGLNEGRADFARLRMAVAGLPLPEWPDGRIRLAVDVSSWLRPEAATSPERMFCHVHGRGRNAGQMIPGWPYSVVAALGPGASSWTVLLDAVRAGPYDDATDLTAAQLREVVQRLAAAGRHGDGDPAVIVVMDAGYDATRLAWLLADLPVVLCARLRSSRVLYAPAPPRDPSVPGRVPKHTGAAVRCTAQASGDGAALAADAGTSHGPAAVTAWHRMHPKLTRVRTGWSSHPPGQELPLVEGTLIRLAPHAAAREPMWLWASVPQAGEAEVAALWQAYLRRFDIEHVFRFLKTQLGWDKPLLRDPAAADLWTWLVIAAYDQLYLARPLAADIRLPWQQPRPAAAMTPGRVRAAFRAVRHTAGTPVNAPKPAKPGPGRPKGSKNKTRAPLQTVGKRNRKRPKPAKKTKQTG
jgi:DDE superfamily endonuclease